MIAVQNVSSTPWHGKEHGIGYRWHDMSENRTLPLVFAGEFPVDVVSGQETRVQVTLETPVQEGEYVLVWFVVRHAGNVEELKDAYSPGILCLIKSGAGSGMTLSSKAQSYLNAMGQERRDLEKMRVPGRRELWAAAIRMFWSRPWLGFGPDSFRLQKWEHMDIAKGDVNILANSLYLDLLSGSGILGLLSFLWLLWECGRLVMVKTVGAELTPGARAAAFFGTAYLMLLVMHGFVDYFLKFTPTFLLFWLTVGILSASARHATERPDANRI